MEQKSFPLTPPPSFKNFGAAGRLFPVEGRLEFELLSAAAAAANRDGSRAGLAASAVAVAMSVPPRPSPLPWGEGAPSAAFADRHGVGGRTI